MNTRGIVSRIMPRIFSFPLEINKVEVITKTKQDLITRQHFSSFNYTPITNMLYLKSNNKNNIPRFYATEAKSTEMIVVDYDYVRKATSNSDVLIVDVREPDEIKEHGKIPNSINIPLGNVATVLSTVADKEFKQAYNRPKPSEDTEIIFYCMIGRRSGMAQENAHNLGYKNVKNYLGSWTDWATKSQ